MAKNKLKKEIKKLKKLVKKEAKKNKKKGNNMATIWDRIGGFGNYRYQVSITEPKDSEANETLNLVVFSQNFLNNMAAKLLPKAGGSEFQTHYRAVQIIIQGKKEWGDESRLVFTIPTLFFNFPQKVSTGRVDFDLREVAKISETHKEESMKIAENILTQFPLDYFRQLGFEVKVREGEIGSIHRHPGDFSFSSTDLDKNPKNPGVIYRQAEANDHIQVDSVLYMQTNNNVKLVTTQTRVVNVKPAADGGVDGTYARAKTIAMIKKDIEGEIEEVKTTKRINFNKFFTKDQVEDFVIGEHVKAFLNRFDRISEREAEEFLNQAAMVYKILFAKSYMPVDRNVPDRIEQAYAYNYANYSYLTSSTKTTGSTGSRTYDNNNREPNDFSVEEITEYLKIDPEIDQVDSISDGELQTFYWNCLKDPDTAIEIPLADGKIIIEEFSRASSVFKVIKKILTEDKNSTVTSFVSKGHKEDWDASVELQAGINCEGEIKDTQENDYPYVDTKIKEDLLCQEDIDIFKTIFKKEYGKEADFEAINEVIQNDDKLKKVIFMHPNIDAFEITSSDLSYGLTITKMEKEKYEILFEFPGGSYNYFVEVPGKDDAK